VLLAEIALGNMLMLKSRRRDGRINHLEVGGVLRSDWTVAE
jgi:hypothetical protein